MIETADSDSGGDEAKSENPFFQCISLEELVEDEPRGKHLCEVKIVYNVRKSLF